MSTSAITPVLSEESATHLKNLRIALWRWESIPPENVYYRLAEWCDERAVDEPTCNTVACFGGWVALMPEFKEYGVRVGGVGEPLMPGVDGGVRSVAARLFGSYAMFNARDAHPSDEGFIGTDHELVTNRIKHAIARLEAK